eukprot:605858_1
METTDSALNCYMECANASTSQLPRTRTTSTSGQRSAWNDTQSASQNRMSLNFLKCVVEKHIENGQDNEDKTKLIVDALGGINNLLNVLVTIDNEPIIGNGQRQRLYQILTTPRHSQSHQQSATTINHIVTRHQEKPDRIDLILDPNDNYLQKWLGERMALKLKSFIHNKMSIFAICLSLVCWIAIWLFVPTILFVFQICCCISIWFPYLILNVATVNVVAFKKLRKTTDVWITLFYMNVYVFCFFWYSRPSAHEPLLMHCLHGIGILLGLIATFFALLLQSLFDGFRGNKRSKLIFGVTIGLRFLFMSGYWSMLSYSNGDDTVIVLYGPIRFSLLGTLSSSAQIMGIFVLKQCFFIVLFQKNKPHRLYIDHLLYGKILKHLHKMVRIHQPNPLILKLLN